MKSLILILTLLSLSNTFASTKKPSNWHVKHAEWSRFHEKSYEEFVHLLGMAKKAGVCHTTNDCLQSKVANPKFANQNPKELKNIFADCADLPYILRGYFAWMNDLPFSYPTSLTPAHWYSPKNVAVMNEIKALQKKLYSTKGYFKKKSLKRKIKKLKKKLNGGKKVGDIRYNAYGNVITAKRYVKSGDNIKEVLRSISGSISTASFRTNAIKHDTGKYFRDTYPVKIDRKNIRPGTVLYDPNGHIAVVYNVTDNGKIQLIDAHPDNSLTAITYGEKFSRTDVHVAGGFSNWRPFKQQGASVIPSPNSELEGFSDEQFYGNYQQTKSWKKAKYVHNGEELDYYEYMRFALSKGELKYDPVNELEELLDELCYDLKERNVSVELAIKANMDKKAHPERLPENIYGTEGEWETYSTPSRDARFKASIREGRKLMIKLLDSYERGSSSVIYEGMDLLGDLNRAYNLKTSQCKISFKDSFGESLELDLDFAIENIFSFSFDPYHCVEYRWGILDGNCSQSSNLNRWYDAEQGLRNRIDRDYSMKMNYSLYELPDASISNVEQENISIKEVLK